ncbi:sulfatase [Croceibacterium mercuriale]|uniref:Sulfatase n=1 Tax=Croceibacterium mercuriale TaxID=1572751 RepID=A0A0B2BS27_9SPHN|nr:sulfatase-like hydrolase/transferase [Croceibacterium mercuriale]KHL24171.1 sulfatase [Croceibacterium mercuriale]
MNATRRQALASIALGGASLSARAVAGPAIGKPNILWLVSEDNNPLIGAYGDRLARTPVIDGLAGRGILYRNVYCNAPVCAPSRFGILTGCYPESCGPAHHMRATARLPAILRTYPEYMRSAGYYCSNNDKTDYNCDVDPARIWDASSSSAHWRDRPDGKPFMSVFNYMTTHESRIFSPTPGPVTPDQVRVPAYLPDTPAMRGDFASYYNLMSRMDTQVGERLAELEADGLAEDTIIFYYSDNGGVLPRSKRYCYDEGLRVALIVYVPPKWQHLSPVAMGSEVTEPVSFIDLAPTLLSLANIPRPATMAGAAFLGPHIGRRDGWVFGMRNRMDERYDFVRTATDGRYRYIRNYMPHRPWGMHGDFAWLAKGYQSWDEERLAGRLTPAQTRFFGPKPFEEFYDLQADADQLDNRIADPAQARRIAAFRTALDRHMLAIRDNGFIPEGAHGEGYAESRVERDYPLRSVMRLAAVAARGDPRNAARLSAMLRHANSTMRYWAATGLVILKMAAAGSSGKLAAIAGHDPSPPVRVAAAEALCGAGRDDIGLPILAEVLESTAAMPPRLMALNALDALGPLARPALPAIAAAVQDENEYITRVAGYLEAVLEGRYTPGMTFGRGRQGA